MREDMSRVIVERPRLGGGHGRKGRALPLEDLPSKEGIRRPHRRGHNYKSLNENLAPLRRYLERQVGRPWNKVYSEISRQLRTDNPVQQHVRDHLKDFVAIKPRRIPYPLYRADGSIAQPDRLWHEPLYVDPIDGLLKRTDRLPEAKAERRARRRPPPPPGPIALATDHELRRIDGSWYEITLAVLPEPEYRPVRETRKLVLNHRYGLRAREIEIEVTVRRLVTPGVRDIVSGRAVSLGPETDDERAWKEYRRTQPDRRYAVGKRALSRRELRRHGLRNEPRED
jgi:hypothetical protein